MTSSLLINLSFVPRQPTGLATYALNLFPHLKALDPTLLASSEIADFANFPCYPVPAGMTPEQGKQGHLRRLLWTQFSLPRLYRRLQAQLLFSPIPEAPIGTGCRTIVTVHDLIPLRFPQRFSPLTLYNRYYLPLVLQQAQHILCVSESTARDVSQFFQIPARKITPIASAHDRQNFRFLDLPTQNYFLYLGRIDPYKNVHRLIAAFAALPERLTYELWIAGPPDPRYLPSLKTQIHELGLGEQVKFLSYVPYQELPRLINQAIALVFPSLWEGFGLPVLEAMACGTPVITSNLASLPEVAGDAGILIDPYNVTAIAEAMQAVATDSALRAQLSAASLQRAAQFSWEKTGAATAEVLQPYLA